MTLSPGARLGHYEVVAPLGAGGMGEVYRGRDPRLGREVAIKVLPAHLADTPEARARLDREAKAIAALNHPHICTLYDIGHQNGVDYLVMELVEGETLEHRLEKGPLPVAEVLRLGEQIAAALGRAHKQGIVHRDLKPGNAMLTRAGAKLMDFGLARPAAPGDAASALLSGATMTRPLTREGALVGTFQYMAPEQLEGKEADARTDLFAFGALLYEAATGKRAFAGDSQASLISSIMKDEPRPLGELVPLSPPALERAVRQCLAKDPEDRWQSAGDLQRELSWIASAASQPGVAPLVTARRRRRASLAWVPVAVGALLAAAGVWRGAARHAADPHMHVVLTHDTGGTVLPEPACAAISPDGRRIAYVVTSSGAALLYVRDIGEAAPRKATELTGVLDVFWSPDSRFLGFITSGDDARMWKVPAEGGAPVSICDVKWSRGATWSKKGDIVFAPAPEGPLLRVSASGGDAAPVTALDASRHETGHRSPCFLPDDEHFLFASLPQEERGWKIFVGSLRSKEVHEVLTAGSAVTYAEPGYLLYVRDEKLVAQRFDVKKLALAGDPLPIADPPAAGTMDAARTATASLDGRLVMLRNALTPTQVQWVDRNGQPVSVVPVPAGHYWGVTASADGRSALAVRNVSAAMNEIWQADVQSGTTTRVTPAGSYGSNPVWTPDGTSVCYTISGTSGQRIVLWRVGGAADPRQLRTSDAQFQSPTAITPDGRTLIFTAVAATTQFDLFSVAMDGSAAPMPVVRTSAWESEGAVSPDGRWLAFSSDETGKQEVYVQSFPVSTGRVRVSAEGGAAPQWSRDGKEILYLHQDSGGGSVVGVAVDGGAAFHAATRRALFRTAGLVAFSSTRDGERILISAESGVNTPPSISLILDWPQQLRDR